MNERRELVHVAERLIEAINATGGIFVDEKGSTRPVGDPEWVDLAAVYEDACVAIGVEPEWGGDPR